MREEERLLARRQLVARPLQPDRQRLDDAAGIGGQRDDAVAEIDRFLEIVGDEHGGDAALAGEPRDLVLQALTRHRVERAERLVHQHDARLLRQAARDLHALLHAARELAREILAHFGEPHELQQRGGPRAPLGSRDALRFVGKGHVRPYAAPRQERAAVILEHDRALARRAAHRLPGGEDLARGWRQQPGEEPQQGRLAAARWADDAQEFALGDGDVDAVEHQLRTEPHAQTAGLERRCRRVLRVPREGEGQSAGWRLIPRHGASRSSIFVVPLVMPSPLQVSIQN